MANVKIRKKRVGAAYHHGDLRDALVAAAALVAAQDGVDAVRVSALASRTGVSRGAPFRHFPTRLALLVAVAEQGARLLGERAARAAASASDPLMAERARGVAYVRFAVEEPGYFRVMSRPEVWLASPVLQALDMQTTEVMDAALGRNSRGRASPAIAARSAGMLAAQAITYGLARMITDGLLGEVTADEAEHLAFEITGVLGRGLQR